MRRLLVSAAAIVVAAALASCTPTGDSAAPTPTPTSSVDEGGSGSAGGPSVFPTCDAVFAALSGVLADLHYDEALSAQQTAPEAYDQRVCVYLTADEQTQIGVTFAAIPFQRSELESYRSLPNSIADDRLAEHGAVLQTLRADDLDDEHLDSALYLFDEQYSVTIQGFARSGEPTTESLPSLSIASATDAAFAARDLIG